jgi:ADP-ribose pyrophosphatase
LVRKSNSWVSDLSSHDDEVKAWEILSSSPALDEPWMKIRKDTVKLPSGKILHDYFLWESPNIATIVPLTPDNHFVLCRQYRHAVGKIMLQFPAGAIEVGETPAQAAGRELKEETGYAAPLLEPLGVISAYATKLTGWTHLFLARDARPEGVRRHDPEEPTEVVLKTPAELWALIDRGEFQSPDALSAAMLAMRKLGL